MVPNEEIEEGNEKRMYQHYGMSVDVVVGMPSLRENDAHIVQWGQLAPAASKGGVSSINWYSQTIHIIQWQAYGFANQSIKQVSATS